MAVSAVDNTAAALRQPILRLDGLSVWFNGRQGATAILNGLSLDVPRGSITALTGASGSGKSLTCLAVLGLLPLNARATGRLVFEGTACDAGNTAALAALRGGAIALMLQDPAASLNPIRRVGGQLVETLRFWHPGVSRREATARVAALFGAVGLGTEAELVDRYPHQLSGGQNQRVMAALALASGARLVLADEPTSALDPKTARGLLDLFDRLRCQRDLTFLLISHDLDGVAHYADRIYHIKDGRSLDVSCETHSDDWIGALL